MKIKIEISPEEKATLVLETQERQRDISIKCDDSLLDSYEELREWHKLPKGTRVYFNGTKCTIGRKFKRRDTQDGGIQ